MSEIDRYLQALDEALHVRGRARRRLLAECRDHLTDAADLYGEQEALRRFGSAADIAAEVDVQTAERHAMPATLAALAGVLAIGASTVTVLDAADPATPPVIAWAVVFFGCAQTAGVCALLAMLGVMGMRYRRAEPAEVALLCRRTLLALAFAAATLFAAAAAVPGHAPAWEVVTGPLVGLLATFGVLRVRSLGRGSDAFSRRLVRAPSSDLLAGLRQSPVPHGLIESSSLGLLAPAVVVACAAAFAWDRLDHGSISSAIVAASSEAFMTVLGFLLLGSVLGLRSTRRGSRRTQS